MTRILNNPGPHVCLSADSWKTTGACTPADALGVSQRMSIEGDGGDSSDGEHECPKCGDTFPTDRGMRQHYGQVHEGSIAGHPITCANCGDTTRIPKCRVDRSEDNYCSNACRFESMQDDLVEVECEVCGEREERKRWWAEQGQNFCSESCLDEWRSTRHQGERNPQYKERQLHVCEWCGADVERRQSYPVGTNTFCPGRDCYANWLSENLTGPNHPRWSGGQFPYGDGWTESKKEAVRERDGRECQMCGRSEERHIEMFGTKHSVHHIQKARTFDGPEARNAMDNLITLCRGECHHTWEQMSPLRPDTIAD